MRRSLARMARCPSARFWFFSRQLSQRQRRRLADACRQKNEEYVWTPSTAGWRPEAGCHRSERDHVHGAFGALNMTMTRRDMSEFPLRSHCCTDNLAEPGGLDEPSLGVPAARG